MADTSKLALASKHLATERFIKESGLTSVFLRNCWYLENQTENLSSALEHGVILGAAAAVAVLTTQGHGNKIYELAGDRAFTLAEFAQEVATQSGKRITYRDMPGPEYEKALIGFGIPAVFAHVLADSNVGASKGELDSHSKDLSHLIGHTTTPMALAVKEGLVNLKV